MAQGRHYYESVKFVPFHELNSSNESSITKQRRCEGTPQFPSYAAPTEGKKKKKIQPRQRIIGLARYLAACGDGTRRFTASVKRIFTLMVLGTVRSSKYPRPDVSPGAVVQRFLLYVPACQLYG
jgi:hypothetical protein